MTVLLYCCIVVPPKFWGLPKNPIFGEWGAGGAGAAKAAAKVRACPLPLCAGRGERPAAVAGGRHFPPAEPMAAAAAAAAATAWWWWW